MGIVKRASLYAQCTNSWGMILLLSLQRCSTQDKFGEHLIWPFILWWGLVEGPGRLSRNFLRATHFSWYPRSNSQYLVDWMRTWSLHSLRKFRFSSHLSSFNLFFLVIRINTRWADSYSQANMALAAYTTKKGVSTRDMFVVFSFA